MRNRKRILMLTFRALYALAVLVAAALGGWTALLYGAVIFVLTLFVPWLGRKDDHYYTLDALIMLTFSLALIPGHYGWPAPSTILGTIFCYDKLFHMAAGAVLAGFAAVLMHREVRHRWFFYGGIVAFAVMVGAVWEVYEWALSVLPPPLFVPTTGYADSMLDIVADTLGACVVAFFLRLRRYL